MAVDYEHFAQMSILFASSISTVNELCQPKGIGIQSQTPIDTPEALIEVLTLFFEHRQEHEVSVRRTRTPLSCVTAITSSPAYTEEECLCQ